MKAPDSISMMTLHRIVATRAARSEHVDCSDCEKYRVHLKQLLELHAADEYSRKKSLHECAENSHKEKKARRKSS